MSDLPAIDIFNDPEYSYEIVIKDIKKAIEDHWGLEHEIMTADPLYHAIRVFAHRELKLRRRINNVAEVFLEELRRIGKEKAPPLGTRQYYLDKVLSYEQDGKRLIKDVRLETRFGGNVHLFLLPVDDNDYSIKIKDYLDEERPLNDRITVSTASPKSIAIKAHLIVKPGRIISRQVIEQSFRKAFASEARLGAVITPSGVNARLHTENIQEVVLIKPSARIECSHSEWPRLDDFDIGEDL